MTAPPPALSADGPDPTGTGVWTALRNAHRLGCGAPLTASQVRELVFLLEAKDKLINGQAERIALQSELLSRRAEAPK